jgi:hypothetical protein
MSVRHSYASLAALVLASLIALGALLWGYDQLFGFGAFSRWGRTVGSIAPPVLGLFTVAFVVGLVSRDEAHAGPARWAWIAFLGCAVVGYLAARDGYSYWTYVRRPGGLPGGCYTQLEVKLNVPHDYSAIRNLEQALGSILFFGSPLLLIAGLPRTQQHVAHRSIPIKGA